MIEKTVCKILAISIFLALIASSAAVFSAANFGICDEGVEEGGGRSVTSLELPSFVAVARGSEVHVMSAGTNFLEEEAGIAAYTNVMMDIDIDKAKAVYRTIEVEKENYTIGSVALPDYDESEDVHMYVHKDGWIVAYYLKDEPIAKMVSYKYYQEDGDITLKLDTALGQMCDGVGLPLISTNYYDFRYPNANKIMIIVDGQWVEGTNTFDIKIPSDVRVYDRSWCHWLWHSGGSNFYLDGTKINSLDECSRCWQVGYGKLTPSQLMPEEFHTVSLWYDAYSQPSFACIAIALAYKEV
jgi:hypothetical protein